jgi:hypothetical protein
MWPYRKHGFYRRLAPPHRIQLYGLAGQHWLPEQVLGWRLFRTRIPLPPRWVEYWEG